MLRSRPWFVVCLLLPAMLIVAGMAAAFDIALASSSSDAPAFNSLFKDGDDDDKDDDNSGHGHGDDDDDHDDSGHGDDHDDDDDRDGDVARPSIPEADLGDVVVEIIDEQFVPATFALEAGQRVTFINLDDDEHTGTGLGFDTGKLNPGEWATVTILKGGAIPFICQFHSEMQGEITVSGGTPVASPSPVPVALTPAGTPSGDAITIDILDFAFTETALEISVGTTVTWVNTGQAPHTVTGGFGDSGMLQAGQSFSVTFGEAGVFDYLCQFHPDMTARITVN